MAWIESHQKLEKSAKLIKLASILGINKYQAIGHIHAFWWWCLDNAEDGDVTRFDSVTVAHVVGWDTYLNDEREMSRINESVNEGTPEDFMDALLAVGFLDKKDEKILVHNWHEYTDRYFDIVEKTRINREQTRKRVKEYRERNANVTHPKTLRNDDVTQCNAPTRPNLTKPVTTTAITRFVPPTASEVTAYAASIGFQIDGQKFVDHYAASDWMRGKSKIKDWKACVRTWRSHSDTREKSTIVV